MMTHVRTSTVMSLALALSFLLTGCDGAGPDKAGLKYRVKGAGLQVVYPSSMVKFWVVV